MRLIIFDFDGVVADSERLGNELLAENLTRIGLPTTTEDALRLYLGRRWHDCVPLMEERLGRALPQDFLVSQVAAVHARIEAKVQPVNGVLEFLQRHADVPRCIASSSGLDYIGRCLDRMAMAHWFEHRFSGHDVPRGKPYPDLFLKAASELRTSPAECLVIEDSAAGVMAGKSAGMTTIGLCAGSHAREGHPQVLADAGADRVVGSFAELSRVMTDLSS